MGIILRALPFFIQRRSYLMRGSAASYVDEKRSDRLVERLLLVRELGVVCVPSVNSDGPILCCRVQLARTQSAVYYS